MVVREANGGKPIFATQLEEPTFFKLVRQWILAGLEELAKIEALKKGEVE